jgi:hypothetical protein
LEYFVRLAVYTLALALLCALSACGGSAPELAASETRLPEAGALDTRSLPQLPTPLELVGQSGASRQSSAVGDSVLLTGDQFDETLPNLNVTGSSFFELLFMSGGWQGSKDPADLSYGMFSFDLTGLTPEPRVRADWIIGPYEGDAAYIAVANFDSNRWQWFDGVANLPALEPYKDANQRMLVVVLLAGTNDLQLGGVSVGVAWDSTEVVDYGVFDQIQLNTDIELVLADGFPAIAYIEEIQDSQEFYVRFVRALDANGKSWGAAIDLLGPFPYVGGISLALVDGNPAIAWHDEERTEDSDSLGSLNFIRATDAQGTSWGESIVVNDGMGDNHGIAPYLTIINGLPAISYNNDGADGFSKGLMYVQASAADGSAWKTPVEVKGPVSGGYGPYGAPLVEIDGFPAMAYQAGIDREIVGYVRSVDANGDEWNFGTTFNVSNYSGYSLFLADFGGVPAMVYDTNNTDITRWRVANDADGQVWQDPVTVYASGPGDPGSQPRGLVFVDGNPGVLVDQYNDNRLVFVRADDSMGSSWGEPEHVTYTQEYSGMSNMKMLGEVPAFVYVNGGQLVYSQLN